jgi:hypothetical protein
MPPSDTDPICTIRIRGWLDPTWSGWFGDLRITRLAGGDTELSGSLPDQAALHGVLARIRDLGLVLLSVTVSDS